MNFKINYIIEYILFKNKYNNISNTMLQKPIKVSMLFIDNLESRLCWNVYVKQLSLKLKNLELVYSYIIYINKYSM